jgi:hypothetical protein
MPNIETREGRARPVGWDYDTPDPEDQRCMTCNSSGLVRTGNRHAGYMGTSSTGIWAVRCPSGCNKGLRRRTKP